jgi:hypothetical protein
MITYEVFSGPRDQIIAISTKATDGHWTVKKGTQGKRLTVSQWPVQDHSTLLSLKKRILTSDYSYQCTGRIDTKGNLVSTSHGVCVHWEISESDINRLRQDLESQVQRLTDCGVKLRIADDSIGYVVATDQWQFGITARSTVNCVSAYHGNGAGTVFVNTAAECLALLCVLSAHHPFRFSQEGRAITRVQALSLAGPHLSNEALSYANEIADAPLTVRLRTTARRQITF